jgi:hypothetical protein
MTKRRPPADAARRIREVARRLVASGAVGDDRARRAGALGTPVPVRAPSGDVHSWFVPVAAGDRLAACLQLLPDGTLMRYSSFATPPPAADWLDARTVLRRARTAQRPGETPGRPFLTYDRAPDRLAWGVIFTAANGAERLVLVAGETVYSPDAGGGIGGGAPT